MGGQQRLYQLGFPQTDTIGQSALGGHPRGCGSAAFGNHNGQCSFKDTKQLGGPVTVMTPAPSFRPR